MEQEEEKSIPIPIIKPMKFQSEKEYTAEAVANRWAEHRNAWLAATNKGPDVHEGLPSNPIPQDREDLERRRVKKTMKSVSPPYLKWPAYYPLEDTIDLYMQIWYDDSSSSDSSDS